MKKEQRTGLRTWIEIDTKAIRKNFRLFRDLLSQDVKVCSVVKSNAYGHCLFDFAEKMEENGVDQFAVDSISEGLRLRREGVQKPMLVLGYTLAENLPKAAEQNISITVSGKDALKSVLEYKGRKKIKIHLKFDTGMNRQGFKEEDLPYLFRKLKSQNNGGFIVEGVYTHFADAKDPKKKKNTKEQIRKFDRIVQAFKEEGMEDILTHACATSGALIYPEAHYDMVRIGIGMYGLWPSGKVKEHFIEELPVKRILNWKTIVCDVKKASAGSGFGYGFTEKAYKDISFAVLPVGYWHGYPRSLSSVGEVLIKGKRAKILGVISMDMMMVDITGIEGVKVGDEVVLIGSQKGEEITPEELADKAGTTNYELVTRINPLIKKFYQ